LRCFRRLQGMGLEVLKRDRAAEVVALKFVAAALKQKLVLRGRFNALGQDNQVKIKTYSHNAFDKRCTARAFKRVLNKAAIDLELTEMMPSECRKIPSIVKTEATGYPMPVSCWHCHWV